MRKGWFVNLLFLLFCLSPLAAEDVTGFWETIDKKTQKPSSVLAFYSYQGKIYGKIIATYNDEGMIEDTIYSPKSRAPGIAGKPHYCGLDIVWDLKPNRRGTKYNGYIVNPRSGEVYDAEIWRRGENLIVRGKVLIFGKNMTFPPFPEEEFTKEFKKPDLSTLVPNTPQAND